MERKLVKFVLCVRIF